MPGRDMQQTRGGGRVIWRAGARMPSGFAFDRLPYTDLAFIHPHQSVDQPGKLFVPMSDDQHCHAAMQRADRIEHQPVVVRIERAGRFVEYQQLRPPEQGAGERQTLLFAAGKLDASFSNFGVESLRQAPHQLGQRRLRESLPDLSVAGRGIAPDKVVANGAMLNQSFLRDIRDAAPPAGQLL